MKTLRRLVMIFALLQIIFSLINADFILAGWAFNTMVWAHIAKDQD